MNLFKRYILSKPDGSAEIVGEVEFVNRMLRYAGIQANQQRYHDWCKKVGIPYPVVLEDVDGKDFKTLNVEHLMRYMESSGFEFEEI